jgi:hypothetical protein
MTYTAPSAEALAKRTGPVSKKMATECALIATDLTDHQTRLGLAQRKFVTLTAGAGTTSAVATTGIDLATGSDITLDGFFFPKPVTLVAMHDYLTEAYAKDTTDAKIEIYNNAGTPAKLFGRTLTAGGELAKAAHITLPETGKAAVTAGTAITLKAVNTGSSSGTGHAIVTIEYLEAV